MADVILRGYSLVISRDWDQNYAVDGEDSNENSPDKSASINNNINIDSNDERPFQLRSYSEHVSIIVLFVYIFTCI